ncbi:MAG: ABC transporter ATP-binding protein [Candidatus Cloacimonas sp. 4484_209]|nr:MAG: ABC transporter ATP-binding protein [Candidatus Cloacimonas sp. 4484_209]
MLEIKNLYYAAGSKKILKGVNLTVGKGEIRSIIGVNGTGKTTLAAIIMGLEGYRPTKGKILYNKRDITNLSVTERAKLGITLAWQSPATFEGITVREYLSIGESANNVDKYLRFVGLNPNVYLNRVVDESLSGGERKRIELASVFSTKPKLVILDEPDSGIDMASISAIRNVIRSFKKIGTSIFLITHNENMAKIGDRVSLLCSGEVLKEGTPEEVTKFFKKHCKSCDHIGKIDEKELK